MSTVHYELSGSELSGAIAVIAVDNPPVNAFSHAVRIGLADGLQRAFADPVVRAVVVLGMGKTFFAGADIREFEKRFERPRVRDIQDMLDAANKPVIAAIHGTAFGGGLEFALTCHGRVALPSAQVALPEIKLGLMPGAGGTQRLPRLIGVEAAFDIMYSGNPLPATRAQQLGIIDELIADNKGVNDLRDGALLFAEKIVAENKPLRIVSADNQLIANTDAAVFAALRAKIAKKTRGQIAPEKIIQSLEAACRLEFLEGLEFEHECFQACYDSPQHYAMQHLFFAEREARKIANIGADIKPSPIRSAAVIGAGNMGGGIAMCFANAGIPVTRLAQRTEKNRGGAIDRQCNRLRRVKKCRYRDRSGVRGHAGQAADFCRARSQCRAAYHSRIQYIDVGYRCACSGDAAAR
jgi:3-hydroxyacyl-CoA dehydrogenase